uniref:Sodium-coupled monocarboxylate transporter 1 n=1 Tax=Timema bartmani TaxID=61472 RepID=A0A7R9F832_9NEOP|nr:unnamed protein product [Timema bartmani]
MSLTVSLPLWDSKLIYYMSLTVSLPPLGLQTHILHVSHRLPPPSGTPNSHITCLSPSPFSSGTPNSHIACLPPSPFPLWDSKLIYYMSLTVSLPPLGLQTHILHVSHRLPSPLELQTHILHVSHRLPPSLGLQTHILHVSHRLPSPLELQTHILHVSRRLPFPLWDSKLIYYMSLTVSLSPLGLNSHITCLAYNNVRVVCLVCLVWFAGDEDFGVRIPARIRICPRKCSVTKVWAYSAGIAKLFKHVCTTGCIEVRRAAIHTSTSWSTAAENTTTNSKQHTSPTRNHVLHLLSVLCVAVLHPLVELVPFDLSPNNVIPNGETHSRSVDVFWGSDQCTATPQVQLSCQMLHGGHETYISGVTVLGIPAEMYLFGTQYWMSVTVEVFVNITMIFAYLPIFYTLQITSSYEYLKLRFNQSVCLLGSALFLLKLNDGSQRIRRYGNIYRVKRWLRVEIFQKHFSKTLSTPERAASRKMFSGETKFLEIVASLLTTQYGLRSLKSGVGLETIPSGYELSLTTSIEEEIILLPHPFRSSMLYIPVVIYIPALAFSQGLDKPKTMQRSYFELRPPMNYRTQVNCHSVNLSLDELWVMNKLFTATWNLHVHRSEAIVQARNGGLKAVVWSDTLQLILMFGGVIVVMILGTIKIGGPEVVFQRSEQSGRLEFFNLDLDPTVRHTFWSVTIGNYFSWLSSSAVNQAMVQRCLALPNIKKANYTIVILTIGIACIVSMSCYTGLLIYATFADCDPVSARLIRKADQLLPYYVMELSEHVPGLPGLFVAGVFSAALSTMSTGLNSMTGVIFEDLIRPMYKGPISESTASLIMKIVVVIIGTCCVGLVFLVDKLGTIVQVSR